MALIWLGWAAYVAVAPPAAPVPPVVEYEATITAYSCDPAAPMYPCNVTRWGSDPQTSGAACPEAWKLRRVFVAGRWWLCDDTPRHDYIHGLPHIDLRLADNAAAVEWGIRYERVRIE